MQWRWWYKCLSWTLARISPGFHDKDERLSTSGCSPPSPILPDYDDESTMDMEPILSQFDPANFQTLFLPGTGNKPLDPLAVRAIHRTLVEMSAESLAAHLAKTDLQFFGLSEAADDGLESFPESEAETRSKLANLWLTSELGRQLRQDVLDRCLCLRTLVSNNLL